MAAAPDLTAALPGYRARRGRIDVVELPPARYLMVDGEGDPNTAARYADALATLYPVAYRLKFFSKRELGRDHRVLPLEALWWADDLASFTTARDKDRWRWTAMIRTPDWIARAHVDTVVAAVAAAAAAPLLSDLRWDALDEGLVAQALHVGPYDAEAPVLAHLHDEVLPAQGLRPTGHHHEIYLTDARRTAPERLRTILRQPVARV